MRQPKAVIKLQIPAGKATPAPPVGPSLAQHGVDISEFCKKFNQATEDRKGFVVPVEIKVYQDGSYDFKLKQPPVSDFLKKAAGIEKGSGEPKKVKVGQITKQELKNIAQQKMDDLNTNDLQKAMKIIEGTAKNMGIEIS